MKYSIVIAALFSLIGCRTAPPDSLTQSPPPGSWDEEAQLLTLRLSPREGHRIRRVGRTLDQEEPDPASPAYPMVTRSTADRVIEYRDVSPAGAGRVTITTVSEDSKTHNTKGALIDEYRSPLHGRRVALDRAGRDYVLRGEEDLDPGYRTFLEGEAVWPASFFPPGPVKPGANWTVEGEALRKALGLSSMVQGRATVAFQEVVKKEDRLCAVLYATMTYRMKDEFGTSDTTQTVKFNVWIRHGYSIWEFWKSTDHTVSPDGKEETRTASRLDVTADLEPAEDRAPTAADTFARIEEKIRNARSLRVAFETTIEGFGNQSPGRLELLLKEGNRMRLGGERDAKKYEFLSDGKTLLGSGFVRHAPGLAPLGLKRNVSFALGRTGLAFGGMIGVPTVILPDDEFPPVLEHEFKVDELKFREGDPSSAALTYTLTGKNPRTDTFDVTLEYDPKTLGLLKRSIRQRNARKSLSSTEVFTAFEFDVDLGDELFKREEK